MTFIDAQTQPPTTTQIVFFSVVSLAFILCGVWAFNRAHSRSHYRNVYSVRFLFPLVCLLCCVENIYLALSSILIKNSQESLSLHPLLEVLFVLQAIEVPIYLVTIFELTYLIHKRRSTHFLGMSFDEGRLGRRVQDVFSTPCKSFLARNFIRMLSTILCTIGIIVNFDVLPQLQTVDDLAGKAGWFALTNGNGGPRNDVLLSLIPAGILIVCSFVLSITLWRYGTSTSMIVHSSFLNPWFAPFFGTLALAVGQLLSAPWFAVSSNAGLLVYTITLILLIKQIDRDIVAFIEFTDFLRQVAKKGNEINVHNVIDNVDGNGHDTINMSVVHNSIALPELNDTDTV